MSRGFSKHTESYGLLFPGPHRRVSLHVCDLGSATYGIVIGHISDWCSAATCPQTGKAMIKLPGSERTWCPVGPSKSHDMRPIAITRDLAALFGISIDTRLDWFESWSRKDKSSLHMSKLKSVRNSTQWIIHGWSEPRWDWVCNPGSIFFKVWWNCSFPKYRSFIIIAVQALVLGFLKNLES
jgi:hypothetical protein